jgi:ketosteroid isomerase-like protein
MRGLILAAAACLLASPALADTVPVTPQPVVEAERAFAADGAALGIKASFLKWMADDAQVLNPDPTPAMPLYEAKPDAKGPLLQWWPVWAGISRAGDMGFTTGPYAVNGKPGAFYFTVWSKNQDGEWKWIFDGGADAVVDAAEIQVTLDVGPPTAEPAYLSNTNVRPGDAETQSPILDQIERALDEQAASDSAAAYKAVLACDGRIYTEGLVPGIGCTGFGPALAGRPGRLTLTAVGEIMASSGDFAFTWGDASWDKAGAKQPGHFARIWQRRANGENGGWKLVFDELVAS